MTDATDGPLRRVSETQQIVAILGPNIFAWAVNRLPEGIGIDDVRYGDLISVTEDDVFAYVAAHGFDQRVVAEDAVADDRICIVTSACGWRVFYTERGTLSDESEFPSRNDARRDVVRRLMRGARIVLNHRYWHAHGLAFPCGDE